MKRASPPIPARPTPRAVADPAPFVQALALHQKGQLKAAEPLYRQALKERPQHAPSLSNLGTLLRQTGRHAEAIQALHQAVTLDPAHGAAWSNLCNALREVGQLGLAVQAGRKAMERMPSDAAAHSNYGLALFQADRFDEARAALERAVQLNPRHANAWNNLGNVHQRQCRIDSAINCYEQALQIDPGHVVAHSNRLFCLHFTPRYTPDQVAQAHREWGLRHEAPLQDQALPPRATDPHAPVLRVGMVSADLRGHPVADFLKPLISHWPGHRLHLFFYATSPLRDDTSEWLAARAQGWRQVAGLTDAELAQCVRDDAIDVLFDLTGHTANHRLLAFARRPAPVQATWLGYFDTTGMRSIDFIIADPVCVRPGEEGRYTENMVRMPQDFVCYEPPTQAPPVGPLPALAREGTVTFGSQNQLVKVTDDVVALWARVVAPLPNARLLLAGKAFNDSSTQAEYRRRFEAAGLPAQRLELRPGNTKAGVLATYNEIDIALDPFPCAGGTTTCEALWMGVPVVSLYGDRFGGRHSASHLFAVGVGGLVVKDEQAYVDLCHRLAADLPGLARLRAGLRERMRASALCDGAAFAQHFLKAVNAMWAVRHGLPVPA